MEEHLSVGKDDCHREQCSFDLPHPIRMVQCAMNSVSISTAYPRSVIPNMSVHYPSVPPYVHEFDLDYLRSRW